MAMVGALTTRAVRIVHSCVNKERYPEYRYQNQSQTPYLLHNLEAHLTSLLWRIPCDNHATSKEMLRRLTGHPGSCFRGMREWPRLSHVRLASPSALSG